MALKRDRPPGRDGEIGGQGAFEDGVGAGRAPNARIGVPCVMRGTADGRGGPNLSRGRMLVDHELAAVLEYDGQNPAAQFDVGIGAVQRRFDLGQKDGQQRVGGGFEGARIQQQTQENL